MYNWGVREVSSPRRPGTGSTAALALAVVALTAINLRAGASALGPVLAEVREDLGLSAGLAGVATSLPGFAFAAFGLLAVVLGRRIGETRALNAAMVAIVVGLALRSVAVEAVLFLSATVLALAGMAVGNVLTPAWIKRNARDGGVRFTMVYTAGLGASGTLGSLLTAPLAEVLPGGWRAAFAVWAVLAVTGLVPWLWWWRREAIERRARATTPAAGPEPAVAGSASADPAAVQSAGAARTAARLAAVPLRRSRSVLALTALFGLQSMNAYVQFGWLPQMLRDAGVDALVAGALLALVAGLGIVGGLTMPAVVSRSRNLAWLMYSFGILLVGGYAIVLFAPVTLGVLGATMLGLSGFAFPTSLVLINARTRHHAVTARVSGFVQPIGYSVAGLGPLLAGIVHDAVGWPPVLYGLMASGVALTAAGLLLNRASIIDDELAAAAGLEPGECIRPS